MTITRCLHPTIHLRIQTHLTVTSSSNLTFLTGIVLDSFKVSQVGSNQPGLEFLLVFRGCALSLRRCSFLIFLQEWRGLNGWMNVPKNVILLRTACGSIFLGL